MTMRESLSFPVEKLFPPPAPIPVETTTALPDDRLFIEEDGAFRPLPLANGPFDTLHGGAIGGLMANAAEALAAERDLGTPIAAHIQFLRPLKSEHRLLVTAEVAQPGRRLTLVDAFIEADDGLRAEARFTFARDAEAIRGLTPLPDGAVHDPETLVDMEAPHRPPGRWFKDALDWRPAPDGTMWMRGRVPLGLDAHVLPRVIAAADWSAGIGRPDGWDRPRAAGFPNPALTVNLWRKPIGDWIGLKPISHWNAAGFGMAQATLLDTHGEIGSAVMPVILVPFPPRTEA